MPTQKATQNQNPQTVKHKNLKKAVSEYLRKPYLF